MMAELVIIFSFILVICLGSLAFASSIHKRQLAYKERKEGIERERSDANPDGANERIMHLEDRVRVLERLATDRGVTLADEIEALRDGRGTGSMPLQQQRDREPI